MRVRERSSDTVCVIHADELNVAFFSLMLRLFLTRVRLSFAMQQLLMSRVRDREEREILIMMPLSSSTDAADAGVARGLSSHSPLASGAEGEEVWMSTRSQASDRRRLRVFVVDH